MAVLKQPYLMLNSVDLSAYIKSVDVSPEVEKVGKTVGNAGGMKGVEAGLEGCTLKYKFLQTFGAALVHETLRAAHKSIVTFEHRISTAAVSTTNPKLTGSALVIYSNPGGGAIGAGLEAEAELTVDGAYTWATS